MSELSGLEGSEVSRSVDSYEEGRTLGWSFFFKMRRSTTPCVKLESGSGLLTHWSDADKAPSHRCCGPNRIIYINMARNFSRTAEVILNKTFVSFHIWSYLKFHLPSGWEIFYTFAKFRVPAGLSWEYTHPGLAISLQSPFQQPEATKGPI